MTEIDYRFRFKIGDALYNRLDRYVENGAEETVMHTVVKRTAKYVYVHDVDDLWHQMRVSEGKGHLSKLVRFSVDDLERDGSAWNGANRMLLYTRPLMHWPLMAAVVK